jgi:Domain of unknown function (DUF4296)
MIKTSLKIFLLSILVACGGSQDTQITIPDNVLSEEKMAKVMVDIHLLEATLNINTYTKDRVNIGTITPTSDILKKNKTTKKEYDDSFNFYTQNPALLGEVYDLVLIDLSKMQSQVMNKK